MKRCQIFLFIALATIACSSAMVGQIAVIVHTSNAVDDLKLTQVRDIYVADMTSWPDGSKIVVVDHKETSASKERFYSQALGSSVQSVKQIWLKKLLAGGVKAPESLASEEAIVEYVSKNKNAIGYVDAKNVTASVKVLSVEGAKPSSGTYKIK